MSTRHVGFDVRDYAKTALLSDSRRECTTAKGAAWVKQRIEEFWRSKGYDVEVTLISAGGNTSTMLARVDVRSDLVNGAPRCKKD